jgi:hypothetical protein
VDAAALCLKSGNAAILRPGSDALRSSLALAGAFAEGLEEAGLPPASAQVVPTPDREATFELLKLDDLIDLAIPRGGPALIRAVAERSRVPVVKHYQGVCHLFLDETAPEDQAIAIALNGKVQRPGVCNALECLLVHRAAAERLLPAVGRALAEAGVEVLLRTSVTAVEPGRVVAGGEELHADAVVLAVPHREAAELLPGASELVGLGVAPIVNLHVVYDRRVTDLPLAAGVGSPVQFVFDRTESHGHTAGQYLAVSLSAAFDYDRLRVDELRAAFEPELERLFPAARAAAVRNFFVTREPAATFRQGPGTRRLRLGTGGGAEGLYLAGAWTDTGWPATMEGAVRSGLAAARAALGVPERQEAAAA